jgi:hypothetical protein
MKCQVDETILQPNARVCCHFLTKFYKPEDRPLDGVLLMQCLHRLLLHEREKVWTLRIREKLLLRQDPAKVFSADVRRKAGMAERKLVRAEI